MYQSKTQLMKKVLIPSAMLAATALLTTLPAGACSVSAGSKTHGASLSAAVGAMALGQVNDTTASTSKPKAQAFVGLWDAKLYYQGQLVDGGEGFDSFHSDGTEILVDQSNPITDNVCLGIWEQSGPSTIKLKHPSWYFDTNGNLLGTVIIYETLTLDCEDSYHGTSSEDVYDLQGNKIAHYDGFEIKASRIKP
jgi:hypothetical protein